MCFPFSLCLNQEHRADNFLSCTSWTETTKVSAVDTFEMGEFFLFSADIPMQMLMAEEAPCSPVNTQGSRIYGRAKGQEWLRQYVIWLSSPGNWSLEKDTQFSLPWGGAEPVSRVGRCYWHSDKPRHLLENNTWSRDVLRAAPLQHCCTWVIACELLKPLVKKTATIVYKLWWAGAAKEKLRKHEESLIFPMVFDSACDLLARKILWGSAVSNTSPRGCHNHALDTESQMFTQSSSHTLVSKNYTEKGSARLVSWMALSDSRHPVYKFSPYIFLQFKLQCLINWFDWRECTKSSSNGKSKQLDTCSLSFTVSLVNFGWWFHANHGTEEYSQCCLTEYR